MHWHGRVRDPGLRGVSGHLALLWSYGDTSNCTALRAEPAAFQAGVLTMSSGENATVRWRDGRAPWSTSERVLRRLARFAKALPRARSVVFGADAPISLGGAAAISSLLAERAPDVAQWWVEHPSAPPAPLTARAIRAGSPQHVYLAARARFAIEDDLSAPRKWSQGQRIDANTGAPIVQGSFDPIGVEALRTDPCAVRAAMDITCPVRCVAVDPNDDWVSNAQAVDGAEQLLIRASDGTAVQIPAVLRAWVRDVRVIAAAQLRAICTEDVGEVSTVGVDELISVISP